MNSLFLKYMEISKCWFFFYDLLGYPSYIIRTVSEIGDVVNEFNHLTAKLESNDFFIHEQYINLR